MEIRACLNRWVPPRTTSHFNYYCCFGRVHVKTAVIILTVLLCLALLFETIFYLAGSSHSMLSPTGYYFMEIVEAISVIGMIAALKTGQSIFMWPFMLLQFVIVTGLLIVDLICLITVFFPSNPYRDIFENERVTDEIPNGVIRLRALASLLVYGIASCSWIWGLTVTLACHRYFDDVNDAKALRMRRNRIANMDIHVRGPIVRPSIPSPSQRTYELNMNAADSFANPNFAPEDSDEEGKGKNPFEQQQGSANIV